MATNTFRSEEKLEGSANYNSWKARLIAILEENDLNDLVFNTVEEPTLILVESLSRRRKQRLEGSSMTQSRKP